MGKKDANTLHSTPIAQQRKVLGDSEVHQSFSHAAKEHKQRAVTRKQNHIDLPKRVHAGEVAYPFGIWGKIFASITFLLFIAACLYWIILLTSPKLLRP